MGIFENLLSSNVDKIVDSVGNAANKLFTSDQERLQMQNELEKIRLQAKQEAAKLETEADIKFEEEVTKRWTADTQADDPLAKKIRPFSLVFLLLFMSVIIVTDSVELFSFTVKDVYIDLLQSLLLLVFGAYYGGRSLEKIMNRKR